MNFDQWWEENGARYSADACHMSEYHMAGVVWEAAQKSRDAEIARLIAEVQMLKSNANAQIWRDPP